MKNRFLGITYIIIFAVLVASLIEGLREKGPTVYIATLATALAYLLPAILERIFRIVFPPLFKCAVLLFFFLCLNLGAVLSFYDSCAFWDDIVHFASGILTCTLGLSLISILNGNRPLVLKLLRPGFIAAFIFIFAMAAGLLWELIEFMIDSLFGTNLMNDTPLRNGQTDIGLLDTISDLLYSQASAFLMSMYYYHEIKSDRWLKLSKVMIQPDA